ncbi:MAG: hypothetical protein L6Q99_18730 [Planctomycetes bacterium]|nr:hypothetical protein [Planctomycetota bacterium]
MRIVAVLVGLVGALALAELGTRILLAVRGKPYDAAAAAERIGTLHSGLVDAVPNARRVDAAETANARSQGQVLHPYFGYDFDGYFDALAVELQYYRSQTAQDTYDVMVLGGSVAMNFAQSGIEKLVAELRKDPELANRRIQITKHGRAAHKAPQAWLVLQFMLCAGAKPDAVITLDGFNEVAVGLQNVRQSVAATYPCANVWIALAGAVASDGESLDAALTLRERQLAVIDGAETYARFGLERSALASWIATARIERLGNAATEAAAELQRAVGGATTFRALAGRFEPATDADTVRVLVRAWRESAISLHALCENRGIDFLEILQPTALLADSKPLTQRERESAVADESWRVAVDLGYPELLRVGRELAERGVPFLDATRVFANTEETLYYDTCHFRERGYELLAVEIGRAFVAERAKRQSERR